MADANGDGRDDVTGAVVLPDLASVPPGVSSGGGKGYPAKVYWGEQKQYSLAEIDAGAPAGGGGPKYVPPDTAIGYFAGVRANDPKQYEALRQRMIAAGIVDEEAGWAETSKAWADAVNFSQQAATQGITLAPWDAIDFVGSVYGPNGGSGARNGTYTSSINETNTDTRKAIKLSSAQEARAFLMSAAERELGRAATADEIALFRSALNEQEKKNATTVTTTSKTSGTNTDTYVDGVQTDSNRNTASSSSSTETGGMDRGQFALDAARSAQDWAEYTAATKYMQAMFAALESPVNAGRN